MSAKPGITEKIDTLLDHSTHLTKEMQDLARENAKVLSEAKRLNEQRSDAKKDEKGSDSAD